MYKTLLNAIIGAAIGAAIGAYFLASVATFPNDFEFQTSLYIPVWDARFLSPIKHTDLQTINLEFQAILLRFCSIALEQGFFFIAVPIGLWYALTKLNELGKTRFWPKAVSRSIKLTGVILAALYLLLMTVNFATYEYRSYQVAIFTEVMLLPAVLLWATRQGIVPIIWLLCFAVTSYNLTLTWKDVSQIDKS